ncbi:DUF4381 family protein [Reinekea marina]|uniref:DUF4381 family protein n=1 Tax=Reinekea marina TaxID=1310421 RepID=A0ABV7WQH2_9GAMM|nr:DUF4381 family protein [Reinekea marina]MDN3648653.1 DUF4381 family protein [Reinekea marina]
MVHLTIMNSATQVPPELLAQLVPNDPVSAAPWWPLAIGYWLLLLLLCIVLTIIARVWFKKAKYRSYLKHLNKTKTAPKDQQLSQVHLLLRKVLQDNAAADASVSNQIFANKIKSTLDLDTVPNWVNAHYAQNPNVTVDWIQVKQLIKQWSQEQRV